MSASSSERESGNGQQLAPCCACCSPVLLLMCAKAACEAGNDGSCGGGSATSSSSSLVSSQLQCRFPFVSLLFTVSPTAVGAIALPVNSSRKRRRRCATKWAPAKNWSDDWRRQQCACAWQFFYRVRTYSCHQCSGSLCRVALQPERAYRLPLSGQ